MDGKKLHQAILCCGNAGHSVHSYLSHTSPFNSEMYLFCGFPFSLSFIIVPSKA